MKRLIMLVGLPRSGKSTRAGELAKIYGCPVVNRDAVRLALHGERFLEAAEPMVAVITKIMVKALFRGGNDVVILDECNGTAKRRREWMSDAWSLEFVHIDTPKEVCIERARERGDERIIPVICRMAEAFEFDPGSPLGLDLRE